MQPRGDPVSAQHTKELTNSSEELSGVDFVMTWQRRYTEDGIRDALEF